MGADGDSLSDEPRRRNTSRVYQEIRPPGYDIVDERAARVHRLPIHEDVLKLALLVAELAAGGQALQLFPELVAVTCGRRRTGLPRAPARPLFHSGKRASHDG
jgi:hypothetical protein